MNQSARLDKRKSIKIQSFFEQNKYCSTCTMTGENKQQGPTNSYGVVLSTDSKDSSETKFKNCQSTEGGMIDNRKL